jgi:glycerate kinase
MILLAPDSFKGSLSALEAAACMQRGVRAVPRFASSTCSAIPLADGGEGTLEAVASALGDSCVRRLERVQGPLGEEIEAAWLQLDAQTALIEMAQSCGLTLIAPHERDALRASTFGLGQLMRAALDAGCTRLIIGLGGSATTDGASGALSALGARFLNSHGQVLEPGGAALQNLHSINLANFDARLASIEIEVLCDVSNPLCGIHGAAQIFGPQKGASPDDVQVLDAALSRFADVASQVLARDAREIPGAGAAGGSGFGLMQFCNARLTPGIERILDLARFDEKLRSATLVLTGEGALDEQTLRGKTIAGVCRRAQVLGVPVIAFGGAVRLSGAQMDELGLTSAFSIADGPRSLESCVENAGPLLERVVERALRLWK